MLVAKYKLGVPRPPQALFRQGSMTQGRIYYRHLLHTTTIPTHALRNSLLTPGRHTHSQETYYYSENLVDTQKKKKMI